ncbi:MAG: serine/threonine protein kinase [Myxococcales bacterium]|nr:serine/threonine protein kinase [Myxococcales bacterium]
MNFVDRTGTVVAGKWTLERLLGAGGMAAVYVGVHRIGRRDAIKVLHPEIARSPELRARFDQEARATNRFVHPGVVEIRDIDVTEDDCPFLVMELLEGESLAGRCDRLGPPKPPELLHMVDELLDVLSAAHAEGIVHRDIKPDNLFCLPDGRIKVLDFGVARVRDVAQSVQTRTGMMLGTITYMAPEQINARDVDARADLFAVGATMFRLLANRRIHEAESEGALLVKMATEPAPELSSVAPGLSPELCAVVDRALRFDREARYASARAMQQDVRALGRGEPPAIALAGGGGAKTRALHGDEAATRIFEAARAPAFAAAHAGATGAVPRPNALDSPLRALGTKVTRLATEFTRWTVTSTGEKRLRRAALILPLLGALVLWSIFRLLTDVETPRDARAQMNAEGEPAAVEAETDTTAATAAVAAPEAEAPAPLADEDSPEAPPPAAPDDPAATSGSCIERGDCDELCRGKCKLHCDDEDGCSVGMAHDSKVHCRGHGPCEVACVGECKVKCDGGCLVHCAPGYDCKIERCRLGAQRCAPGVLACGVDCP